MEEKIGIIYIMTTSVVGLIKIGKTDSFKNRMNILEQNGYWNVSGLHPFYAVRVKNYDKKEKLIHTIFSKSQVANSELFALDENIARKLLESFEGEQIYPEIDRVPSFITTPSSTKVPKLSKLTFDMLKIPIGSTLTYVLDNNITCKTVDTTTKVEYQGKIYRLSGLVTYLKNGGSWQGSYFFTYNNERLTDIRKRLQI